MKNEFPFLKALLKKDKQTNSRHRFLVGIIGPPASGKSTLAEKLPGVINQQLGQKVATHFNMDGYHFHNDQLFKKGIHPHKGAHFTFDVQAFIEKLVEIKEVHQDVLCPIYDRSLHNPTPDAHTIKATDRIVIVEGNYLLLSVFPWIGIRFILNYSIFLTIDESTQFQRLMDRHTSTGKTAPEAEAKIYRTDLPNSTLILKDIDRADFVYDSRN